MSRVGTETWHWLGRHVRRQGRSLGAGTAAMALRAAVLLLLPWPLKYIVDSVLLGKPLGAWAAALLPDPLGHRLLLLNVLGGAILVLGCIEAALAYLGNRLLLDAAQRFGVSVGRDFFAHLLRLPMSFHRRHLSGELVARVGGDVGALQQFVATVGMDLVPHLLTICGILAVMLAMNWRYGLLTLAVVPVLMALTRHFAARIRNEARGLRLREGEQSGATQEVFGNVQLAQAFAREAHEERQFAERAGAVLAAGLRLNRVQAGFAPAMNLVIALATGVIAWYGALLVLRGALTAGDLLVFLAYLRAIATPARQMAKAGRVFGRAAVALERIDEYRLEASEIRESAAALTPLGCAGRLEFSAVSFSYQAGVQAVRDISFELEPGRTLALVGATGSGKSTIAALAARFQDPIQGAVRLDGRDLRELSLRFVRTRVALIPQEPLLFHAPLWANIAYGREGAGRSEAVAAAQAAGVDEVIAALPGGFDAMLGERGTTLSGGQRQCIAVARAMLSEAAVVLFDEPSSSIDALTERRLMLALKRLAQRRAVVLIAHRLATVASADLILVLDRGRIVQRGHHAQLSATAGPYAELWRAHGEAASVPPLRLVAGS
ncbi:MAG: ABC transporter ATP-binding protein [Burkholderiales bacterium]|nr:ABC transporter ATP-binding protein [Burkholderiales bacterium]